VTIHRSCRNPTCFEAHSLPSHIVVALNPLCSHSPILSSPTAPNAPRICNSTQLHTPAALAHREGDDAASTVSRAPDARPCEPPFAIHV
jgi:hypothetical protein